MTAVEAIALLHQFQRKQKNGQVIAKHADLDLAARIFWPSIDRLLSDSMPPAAKRILELRDEIGNAVWPERAEKQIRLANFADGRGEYSRKSIERALTWLEAQGFIVLISHAAGRRPGVYEFDRHREISDGLTFPFPVLRGEGEAAKTG
jgi:hypothetical protein